MRYGYRHIDHHLRQFGAQSGSQLSPTNNVAEFDTYSERRVSNPRPPARQGRRAIGPTITVHEVCTNASFSADWSYL